MIQYSLTILNTIGLLYLLFNHIKSFFSYSTNSTFWTKKLCSIYFYYKNRMFFKIIIRNARKEEIKQDLLTMSNECKQNRTQRICAKFSWLKTLEEVEQFKKDYFDADPVLIGNLISDFKTKHNL